MLKCFADIGNMCTALKVKECEGCNFFKTNEQRFKEEENTRERLSSLKNKSINILF